MITKQYLIKSDLWLTIDNQFNLKDRSFNFMKFSRL